MEIRSTRAPVWLVLVVALASTACGSPLSPSQLAELAALTAITDTFSGTLAVGGTAAHPFVGTKSGNITLTLSAVGPDAATLLALGLGTWNGAACTVQVSTNQARLGEAYQASISAAGNYCVAVSDAGTLLEEATYTVQVTHP